MKRTSLFMALAAALLASNFQRVEAGITVYTSRDSFGAAVPGATVETFDGVTAPYTFANGGVFNGVTYATSASANLLITNLYLSLSGANTLGQDALGYFDVGDTVTFTFSKPVKAFGISINTSDTANGGITATTNNGDIVPSYYDPFPNSDPTSPTGQFVGFTSTTPFSSVTIATAGDTASTYTLDNLTYAANLVPEPTSIALAGFGVMSFGLSTWMRRRRTVA